MARPRKTAEQRAADSALNHEIARRLTRAMEARGLSASTLAERSHISRSMMSRVLSGERRPSLPSLHALADALVVPVDHLLGAVELLLPSSAPLAPGLVGYLQRHGDRIAPVVRRHLEAARILAEPGVVLNDAFWAAQRRAWEGVLLTAPFAT